jgi:hypothetical protein
MEYSDLSTSDYVNILKSYNVTIPRNKKEIKDKAEKIIAIKLCSCIKKVSNGDKKKEPVAIGTCTKSILNMKGITRSNFKCKRSQRKITLKKRKTGTKSSKSSKSSKSKKNTTRKSK